MWTHLIKVPLTVRAARPTDIPALLRLQDSSVSTLRVCSENIMNMGILSERYHGAVKCML